MAGENQSYSGEGGAAWANIFSYQRTFKGGAHVGILTTNRFFRGGSHGYKHPENDMALQLDNSQVYMKFQYLFDI